MPMTLRTAAAALLCLAVAGARLHADVVKLTVEKREPFANQGQAYEKLTGRFFGELDPKHPLNAIITDIEHAPAQRARHGGVPRPPSPSSSRWT